MQFRAYIVRGTTSDNVVQSPILSLFVTHFGTIPWQHETSLLFPQPPCTIWLHPTPFVHTLYLTPILVDIDILYKLENERDLGIFFLKAENIKSPLVLFFVSTKTKIEKNVEQEKCFVATLSHFHIIQP